jgi:nitric oxide reductase subunit B
MAVDHATPPPTPQSPQDRRTMLVGKGWVQGVAIVLLFGFFVMGILAYRSYTASMPQPQRVVGPTGETVFTGDDITAGQELFLARGLMQYGSIVGHGGYLGPDYTADYLRRSADFVEQAMRDQGVPDPRTAVIEEFRTNRYDAATGTLQLTALQVAAFNALTRRSTGSSPT